MTGREIVRTVENDAARCDQRIELLVLQALLEGNDPHFGVDFRERLASGREALAKINPEVRVVPLQQRLQDKELDTLVASSSVVLDCSDNFATRHAVNRACVRHRKPLVSGAAVRFDGQVSVFDLRDELSPCYQCLFPENAELEEVRCAVMGVFAPLTGIIGTVQAAETLKLLAGAGETLKGRLLILDALAMQWRTVKLAKDPACAVCASVMA